MGSRRIGEGAVEDRHLLGARQLLLHLYTAPVDVWADNRRITETKGRAPRLPGGGARQPHTEQWDNRFRRQLCLLAWYLEQRCVPRSYLHMEQYPPIRRKLSIIVCD